MTSRRSAARLSVGSVARSHSTVRMPVAEVDHGNDAATRTASASAMRGSASRRKSSTLVTLATVIAPPRRQLRRIARWSLGLVAPRQSAPRLDPIAADDLGEPALVGVEAGAVGLAMPQMQHAGREAPSLRARRRGSGGRRCRNPRGPSRCRRHRSRRPRRGRRARTPCCCRARRATARAAAGAAFRAAARAAARSRLIAARAQRGCANGPKLHCSG